MNKPFNLRSLPHVFQKNFCASMTVAIGLVVVQLNTIMVAQRITTIGYSAPWAL